jgi:polysaccharide export outer membrane protein
MRNLNYFNYLLFLLLLFACASGPESKKGTLPPDIPTKEIESSRQVRRMNERILFGHSSLKAKKSPYQDYRIGPEDLLEISVFDYEKMNKTVRVSSQGNISLPLIGALRVKGLSANELEKEIRDLLAQRYLQDPQVSVFIKEYRSQRISVMGAVDKPGVYDVIGQKTILDVLALAGGLKEDAGQLLFLIRPEAEEGESSEKAEPSDRKKPKGRVIDLERLLVKGDLELNLPVAHGDIINVPISGKIFVTGAVNRPGGFPLKGKKLTVSQAVAMSEGLKPEANGSQTKIFRYGENGEGEIHLVDLDAIQKGKNKDVYLVENDIVIVPKNGVKSFFIEMRDTVRGIFGVGFSLGTL